MRTAIASIDALEILDSRGVPTLQVTVALESGAVGGASVPSGASTGAFEAHELRDRDMARYGGKGVLQAVANVKERIAPALRGQNADMQDDVDRQMIALDGTETKANLGANAILGVSMAVARAAACAASLPLHGYLAQAAALRLPVPMMNVINGGKHADNSLDFQEFMIVPHGAPTFAEAIRYGAETIATLRGLLSERGHSTSVGDEGGFAPNLGSNDEACTLIVEAIEAAGFRPWDDVAIALDPAASSFLTEGGYHLPSMAEAPRSSADLADVYTSMAARFPIASIEDGFAEDDWDAFARQTAQLGQDIQIVGDDLYVTNPKFIRRGVAERATNAVLIKLNQIGTVTEAIEAIRLCREAGWEFVISHRSGETEDAFIADFAVAMGASQIKAGSLCRSERLAKYNRLLAIARDLGPDALFASPY